MRHRARVFRELGAAQHRNIIDTADRRRTHVSRELLITQDGETFFQAELEPVTAGHAVTGPVVKILVTDHCFDPLEAGIDGGVRVGQHTGRIEDIQALVFHRAHVEALDRDDHENIEIVFTTISFLIPPHGILQREHGVIDLVDVVSFSEDAQRHPATAHGPELILDKLKVTGYQRKQVGRLHERVFPGHPVAVIRLTAVNVIAVRQQHRVLRFVRHHRGPEGRHHVRAIRVPGDIAEALGFTLGAVHVAGLIEPLERGVVLRPDAHSGCQLKRSRHIKNHQLVIIDLVFIR